MDLRDLVLATQRLRLAAFRPADALEVFAAVTPAVTRFMSLDPDRGLAPLARPDGGRRGAVPGAARGGERRIPWARRPA